MSLHWIDWTIICVTAVFFIGLAWFTKRYLQSTADFLAANRCAGRYLLTFAEGIAGLGAISIVGGWQMTYKVGFAASWWGNLAIPVSLIMLLTGWVIYRYRETRAMTMAQFFEMRYSRRFRIFAGIICWISGILNFGIFPAVGANFFINYCGLAESYSIAGVSISTYHSLLILLVGIALYFTFAGGQIAVLITDFFQSFFCNIILLAILVLLLVKFPLSDVFQSLLIAEPGKSMVNPFDAGRSDFSAWYFLIGIVGGLFNRLSWQGSQGYFCSAKNPHEQKMAGVLGGFRGWGFMYALTLVPLIAYMFMHHPAYTAQAQQITQSLAHIGNDEVRDQMLVPMTMRLYMPVGLLGAFAAVMFAAFISTHDTYLHSWGSIFIQDVVQPIRNKPLTTRQHIWALRASIIFVAIFIVTFSSVFRQTQHIVLFFALTGAIWLGGVGAVILGGLYTSWGTTRAAYAALISGSTLAFGGMVCDQLWKKWYNTNFYLPKQYVYIIFLVAAIGAILIGTRVAQLAKGKRLSLAIGLAGILGLAATVILIENSDIAWRLSNKPWPEIRFTMNGQWIYFFAMMTAAEMYVLLSVFGKRKRFNLDKMLHRGKYKIASEHLSEDTASSTHVRKKFQLKNLFGVNEDFSAFDKFIYWVTGVKSMLLFFLFIVFTTWATVWGLSDKGWCRYHYYMLWFMIATSFIIAIWLSAGGIRDVFRLFRDLKNVERDFSDDGRVVDHDYEEEITNDREP